MKRIKRLVTKILPVLFIICSLFFVSSCDLLTGGGGGTGGGGTGGSETGGGGAGGGTGGGGIEWGTTDYTATSIAALKTWLDGKPANTAATPYNIVLNVSELWRQIR